MDRTERFYRIEWLVRRHGGASFAALRSELEVSPATLKRDLAYLRERLNAPIDYDREANVYRLARPVSGAGHARQELPGVWFSEGEIHALLTLHQLLAGLDDGGVLTRHLQPVFDKLSGMLGESSGTSREWMQRVKLIGTARRRVSGRWFERIGSALVERRRLAIAYRKRGDGTRSERIVSPQRLVHYRNTWYLDAWCHASDGLRRFALDAIESAQALDERARAIGAKRLEAELDQGYGIFAAATPRWARLRFSAASAPWVASEEWHPAQRSAWLDDGRYELEVPYADPTELLMDLSRHAGDVEVLAPPALRTAYADRLRRGLVGADAPRQDERAPGRARRRRTSVPPP